MNTGKANLLFRLLILLLLGLAGCSKQDQIELIDHPPVVVPDTTLINYYGNLLLGTSPLPADTIFTQMQLGGNPANPNENTGYDLQAVVAQWPSFLLHWDPHSPNEPRIEEGIYTGCCALTMTDSTRARIFQWIVEGRDPAEFPLLDPVISFEMYDAYDVTIQISDVIELVRTEIIGTDTFHLDQARVRLSGIMRNDQNNSYKGISGDFICYFGRTN
ncbi:MAG: hypothetical protein JNM22_11505 [Saprospiraceae bacterium]|nr:hypothetical protein [Saprospiraceae bacterium]